MNRLNARQFAASLAVWALLLVATSAGRASPATQPASADANFFSVVVLPDTQLYSQKYPDTFYKQTSWVCDNVAKEKIAFVTHVGDVVNRGGKDPNQFVVANKALSMLDGVVPWGIAIGNHDYDHMGDPNGQATLYVKTFGPERFKKYDWFGGASEDGLDSYRIISACGMKFLMLQLQCDAPDATLEWAAGVLKGHAGLPAIVSTHVYLHDKLKGRILKPFFRKGGNSGEDIWKKFVSRQPQVFMVVCGHVSSVNGGEWQQVSTNEKGQPVIELLSDYQSWPNGGDGWLRIMRFVPDKNEVQVRTYSPTLDKFGTGEKSQFSLPIDFAALKTRAAK